MPTRPRKSGNLDDPTTFPEDVVLLCQSLLSDPSEPLANVAKKLIKNDSSELVKMWRTLEQRKYPTDPGDEYVWAFLKSAYDASKQPRYFEKSRQERKELEDQIAKLTEKLATLLKANDLDAHLIHSNGINFNGFYYYEDFGESNQARFDADNVNKLKMSDILKGIADRSTNKIASVPEKGKMGINAMAVRFIRSIHERNMRWCQEPLHAVTATAVNAIYDTSYVESDVCNLIKR